MNREDIIRMAREQGATPYTNRHYPDHPTHTFNPEQLERFFQAAYAAGAAAEREKWMERTAILIRGEREACAEKTGEFARKWWSIHCASNKHMETTRNAHDDFCALQAAIRARSK